MVDNGKLKQCFKCEINYFVCFRKIRGLEKRCTNTRGKRMMKWQIRINFVLKMFLKKFNFERGSN